MEQTKQIAALTLLVFVGSSMLSCSGGSLTTREKGAGIGALGGAAAGGLVGAAGLGGLHDARVALLFTHGVLLLPDLFHAEHHNESDRG